MTTITELLNFQNAEILMPLVLVFLIVFGVLNATKILGGKKYIDSFIAIAIALLTIRSDFVVSRINSFIPSIAIMILVALALMLLIGVFNPGWGKAGLGIIFFIVALVVILASIQEEFADNFAFLFTNYSLQIMLLALLTGILIYFLTKKPKAQNRQNEPRNQ